MISMSSSLMILFIIYMMNTTSSFKPYHQYRSSIHHRRYIVGYSRHIIDIYHSSMSLYDMNPTIVSPFDITNTASNANAQVIDDDVEDDDLPLTRENVEKVLNEMRPYLKADGGNVKLTEIDGPIVRLELEGACGSCPSSSMTMKMGLERKLKQRIPEITQVVQMLPNAPVLSAEEVEVVLDGVRPFLSIAGGKITLVNLRGVGGLQPVVSLKMEGSSAALSSVKLEILQRIQRHFMTTLRIDWQ